MLPAVRSHGVSGYLLRTKICPPEFLESCLSSGEIIRTLNPEFEQWNNEDQLLLSWLLASISPSILGHVIHCSSSYELWSILNHLSVTRFRARLLQLRMQLQSLKKGDMAILDYLAKLENLADQCATAGYVMEEDVLVMYALTGLGSDYDPILCSITIRNSEEKLNLKKFTLC